jgi:hypothetical protein
VSPFAVLRCECLACRCACLADHLLRRAESGTYALLCGHCVTGKVGPKREYRSPGKWERRKAVKALGLDPKEWP